MQRHIHATARLLAVAILTLVAACSTPTPPAAPPDELLRPNENLVLQGIPPVPMSLVRQVEPYTQFRGHGFVDWHPQRREMIVTHRAAGASTFQLFRLSRPMGELEPLTRATEPVTSARYEPRDGRYVVYERGTGGNEQTQLYRLDLDTRAETLITDPNERHDLGGWLHREPKLVVTSVPVDRTARDGTRTSIDTVVWLVDPLQPQARRQLATLPGSGWFFGSVSRDDTRISMVRYVSATESEAWLLDVASGRHRKLLPADGAAPATHYAGPFSADGRALFLVSDRAGEFNELMRLDIDSGEMRRVTAPIPWNVESADLSEDGRVLAARLNVEGRDELRLFDAQTLAERPATGLPTGSVTSASFHRGSGELAFAVNSVRGPSELHSLDPATGRVERWTRAATPAGIDTKAYQEQQVVRWPSFDGRRISGLLNLPPERFEGRRPVLVDIHGGPEGQAKVGFMVRQNHYIQDLGIAVIQPNVRGSDGYGKTFLALDNGMKREDAVKDIGALLDWIARHPRLDPSRVVVLGGSYGGYMSLAVAATYPERIAGAIDVVGISHFVTFLNNTETYRRDLRRSEYGDERDPAMRAFLDRISPLTNAHRITRPLFVAQGRNDPRVPFTEAEQIVAKVRGNGTPVWYLRAENEGHGFARKENADFFFYSAILFLRDTLGVDERGRLRPPARSASR
jgi:protease II